MLSPDLSGRLAMGQETTTPNLKIAFIGDQALGPNSVAVLSLIKAEGAQAVLHSGDLEYTDNPAGWDAQINSVLGPDFPYFVVIGNHDELAWRGAAGYQQYVISRFNRLGINWSGDLGVQSSFHFRGLFFVLTAPGIASGFDNGNNDIYIRDQLASDRSVWSVCGWHKDMKLMQVGGKQDETGWGVYEEARKGGAIIATAHEHSYSRTFLLSSMTNQIIASTSPTMTLTKGNSFAFVSGLGGNSVRAQLLSGAWWASISAATCLPGDPVCQPNGNFGALFGVFNVDGQPNKAFFYFKDINGRIVDSFTVISNVELPAISGLSPASAEAGGDAFTLTVNGENFTNGSMVRWNESNRPTTFISSTQLAATISAADVAAKGLASVTVASPGGISNAGTFTIEPHRVLPIVDDLSPVNAEAGGPSFTLNVNGANFVDSSVVRWNNDNRPTTFVSANHLTAAISAADISAGGAALITVSNPDGKSNVSSFTITPPSLILVTETNSERAIALDSVTLVRDPFPALDAE
jgi:IPT/TIG domain/Calcineurin-like phosphoesterase